MTIYKTLRYTLALLLLIGVSQAYAADASKFIIRDVHTGMKNTEVFDKFKDHFLAQHELSKIPEYEKYSWGQVAAISGCVEQGEENERCNPKIVAYEMAYNGGNTWTDDLLIQSLHGIVYLLRNRQTVVAGSTREECVDTAKGVYDGMKKKYGKPTKADGKDDPAYDYFQSAIWALNDDPRARTNHDDFEGFEFKVTCSQLHNVQSFVIKLTMMAKSAAAKEKATSTLSAPKGKLNL